MCGMEYLLQATIRGLTPGPHVARLGPRQNGPEIRESCLDPVGQNTFDDPSELRLGIPLLVERLSQAQGDSEELPSDRLQMVDDPGDLLLGFVQRRLPPRHQRP